MEEVSTLKKCCDQYDGSFYRVKQDDEKTTVTFLSEVLFNLFTAKIKSDFNLPDDINIYKITTRMNNVRCFIELDLDNANILVSGAAHHSWVKNNFLSKVQHLMVKCVNVSNTNLKELKKFKST